MAPRRVELLHRALDLPVRDRARLAHELLVSLDDESADDPQAVERAWAKEVSRRLDELHSAKAKPIPWKKARTQIAARLRRQRASR